MRLDDMRLVQCLPSCEVDHHRMVPTHHRPVSRAEVLEALGAEKQWMCVDWDADERCNDWDAHDARKCGWEWVVDDAT